ncbi:hypothetical protein LINPERHAP2_LOCUS12005 [Linum perenne]
MRRCLKSSGIGSVRRSESITLLSKVVEATLLVFVLKWISRNLSFLSIG